MKSDMTENQMDKFRYWNNVIRIFIISSDILYISLKVLYIHVIFYVLLCRCIYIYMYVRGCI